MSTFAKLAKKAGKNWDAAKKKAAEFGGQTVPNGRYIAQILKFELGQASGGTGREQVLQEYKVIEGESKGEKVSTYQGLDSDTGISFFIRSLKALGYDPDGIEDCDDIVAEINKEKPNVRITVRGKDDGFPPNIFIDKVLSAAEVEDGRSSAAETTGKEEEVELEIGMKVMATINGEEKEVEIVKILEKLGKVKVKDEDDEEHKVSVEDISAVPEDGNGGKKGKEIDPDDVDDMDRDDLVEVIEDQGLDIDHESKKLKDDDDLREAVREALEEKAEEDPDKKEKKDKVEKKTGSLKRKK